MDAHPEPECPKSKKPFAANIANRTISELCSQESSGGCRICVRQQQGGRNPKRDRKFTHSLTIPDSRTPLVRTRLKATPRQKPKSYDRVTLFLDEVLFWRDTECDLTPYSMINQR